MHLRATKYILEYNSGSISVHDRKGEKGDKSVESIGCCNSLRRNPGEFELGQ